MNRFSTASLPAFVLVLAAAPAAAMEAPKPKAPEMPAFEVAQPYPNLWYGRFGSTNCSWIDTGDGVLVIDTGATAADAKNLKAEIARTTKNKPVKWIAMTNLRPETNDGFVAFLPTDTTIFVNARATGTLATSFAKKTKAPTVIGVSDRIALAAGKRVLEIGVPEGNAHTAFDLYVFDVSTRTVFAGGLVTPDHCPWLLDPDCDLKGWIAALDRLDTLGAQGLVPTHLNPTPAGAPEIERTRRYLTSMLAFLVEQKKQNAPEARVSGELVAQQVGDYCPREVNAINALSVYRRLLIDGTTRPGGAASK